MSIAISEDHRTLADTVRDFLRRHDSLAANRRLLEAEAEELPPFWAEMAALGWMGLHIPEEFGGSGFGTLELAVVVEEMGRALAPGPFVPTVIASAVIAAGGGSDLAGTYLPGLADGRLVGAVATTADASVIDSLITGTAESVLGAGVAQLLVVPVGDDVAVIPHPAGGVEVSVPSSVDPSRRAGRLRMQNAPCQVIPGGRRLLLDMARTLLSAEATGVARECTVQAAAYAKERIQFGRPIGTFQAVKHHCANMAVAAETATAASWDAARAVESGSEQLTYAAAVAAAMAIPAAIQNAELNIQVHGGIGYTWEYSAHLYFRRALAIRALVDDAVAAEEITDMARGNIRRTRSVELPPEAEPIRQEVRRFVEKIQELGPKEQLLAMLDAGYAVPHWPAPWGRDAGAVEQLVVEEELLAAGIEQPNYVITGYLIYTLVHHATEEQVARWVGPALRQELIWCQLFSEPDAGSDAAGVKTRAERVEGGWLVNGQKLWTTMAHEAAFGLATVRTNPDVPKHKGITMMVMDMKSEGLSIRPLRQLTGESHFNEVYFENVFVPDDNVVGPIDGGWNVARAALGNESITVGRGPGSTVAPTAELIARFDDHPERLPGGKSRLGRYIGVNEANELMNLRSAHRAVAGGGPGPEGAITKLVYGDGQQEAAEIHAALVGPELSYTDGPNGAAAANILSSRVWSIGGGTSEIKRNQIGEYILGLPRDPLLA
jgi:alkylation response protein AidB-like acyl-CoA dehydrogenase